MNYQFLDGNLTKEPELITTSGGHSCIKFSIANNDESKKKDDGTYEKNVSFFDCEYWCKKPQYWMTQLVKGRTIAFVGRLKQDRWEKDGQNRSKVKIKVSSFTLGIHKKKTENPLSSPPEDPIPF